MRSLDYTFLLTKSGGNGISLIPQDISANIVFQLAVLIISIRTYTSAVLINPHLQITVKDILTSRLQAKCSH